MTFGATILGCSGLDLEPQEAAFFREADPFGFILFGRNIDSPAQVSRLTAALRDSVGRDAPILIDQEGGRVQRMTPPHWVQWLPPFEQAQQCAPQTAERAMYLRYRLIAAELRDVGIDTNCAPLADVATEYTHPFLRNRCFGSELDQVVRLARATADGLLAGGVLPVIKHMPGHGRATLDSHKSLPKVEASLEDLKSLDFKAFEGLVDVPMAMTAHIVYSALDRLLPATQSPSVVKFMRDHIGYDGLLMTDDLSMQALSGGIADRAEASISAGCDVVLHCNGKMDEMQAAVEASGLLTTKAAQRAEQAIVARKTPDEVDLAALKAEFNDLMAVGRDG